jgi:glycosyltransferase involved in cell wall biosynthesis
LKVLVVHFSSKIPSFAAPTFAISRICEGFSKLNFSVYLFTLSFFSESKKRKSEIFDFYGLTESFYIFKLPFKGFKAFLKPNNLEKILGYLLLMACRLFFGKSYLYTRESLIAYIGVKVGLKIIYETHPFPTGDQKYWDGKTYESKLLPLVHRQNFHLLITLSEQVCEAFGNLGVPRNKLMALPSGIQKTRYEKLKSDGLNKEAARRELDIPQQEKIILYTGKISQLKGYDILMKVARENPEYQFYLLGNWANDKLKHDFQKHNPKNLHYQGQKPASELPVWFSAADVLLLPTITTDRSSQWTSPLKLFEYMASGKPIVSSDLPNVRDILKDYPKSKLVQNDDPALYYEAIHSFFEQDNLDPIPGNQLSEIMEQYTWESRVGQILNKINAKA